MTTALAITVPEADPLTADLRRLHDPSAAAGMPAHLTLLYPFRRSGRIEPATLETLQALFAALPAFDLAFRRVDRFPGVLWLAPEPRAPVDALTHALAEAFPDCPPYGGKFAEPVPHLTVAMGEDSTLGPVEQEMTRRLARPVTARVTRASLFAFDRGWREIARFPLGAAAADPLDAPAPPP